MPSYNYCDYCEHAVSRWGYPKILGGNDICLACNELNTLSALFKEVYGDIIINLFPISNPFKVIKK